MPDWWMQPVHSQIKGKRRRRFTEMVAKVPSYSFNPHWSREKPRAGQVVSHPALSIPNLSPLSPSSSVAAWAFFCLSVPPPSASLRWTHNFSLPALVVLIIVSVSSFRCLRSEGNPRPCFSSLSEPPRVFFWMAVSAHSLAHCTIELPLELPGECLSQQLHWQLFSKVHLIYLI